MKKSLSKNCLKKASLLACLLFGSCIWTMAQQISVSGSVKDPAGEALPGVSISVQGTTKGTVSDANGAYTIDVPGTQSVLQFSYIGYVSQSITVGDRRTIDVVLEDDTKILEEVVVVGFGTQKKVNLTGSVGIATAKEIESRPVRNAVQALQGVIPGLKITTSTGQLNTDMSISIRGEGTISDGSSGSPLILIDGMEGDLNTVNPQDIENISVLKDASASSIYGSRAPFGVILVTTKSGQKGKTVINYNNSFRYASPLNLPQSMDSYTWAVMINQAQINSGGSAYYSEETMRKMLAYQAGELTGGIDPASNNPNGAWQDRWSQGYANTDLYAETYKSSVFSQEHNLSASGGSDRMTYYASANYLQQGGMLKIGDDGIKRYNITGKITAKLTDWLSFNFSTRYTNNYVWAPTIGMYYNTYGRQNWPNIPWYDPAGNLFQDNALTIAYGGTNNNKSDRNYNQAAFIIEPIKNWITKAEINHSILNRNVKKISLPAYGWQPNGDRMTGTTSSSLSQDDMKEKYLNLNIYSEYSRSFADAHNFKIMGGFQSEEMQQNYFYASKYGLLDYDLPEFNLTNGLNGSNTEIAPTITGYSNEWATAGFFGRLNYDYKSRYLFEANLRYDGSSRFRSDSRWVLSPSFSLGWNIAQENFWEPLADAVNLLKLRASYGQLANQNTSAWYPTYRVMSLGALTGTWLTATGTKPNIASVGSLVSTSLTWETVRTWNAGLDYGLLNNRLTGSFDYFTRYTYDMVGPAPELPVTLGISSPRTNNTDLYTKGWELSIAWKDRTAFGLNYGINVSLSDQQTYIDSYPGNITNGLGTIGVPNSSYISGQKLGLIWGFETIGIAKTQEEMDAHLASLPDGGQTELGSEWSAGDIMYKDLDGDGKVSYGTRTLDDHGDLKVLGDANPHYFAGLDLTADWKGIDLRCFLQGVLKHDFWPGGNAYGSQDANSGGYFWGVRGNHTMWHARGFTVHEDYFRDEPIGLGGYELPVNLDSYYPRPIANKGAKNQLVQSRYMQDARYIRIKNLQVGYTLPQAWTHKAGISKCRFFFSGENLVTFTSLFKLFDPETAFGGTGGNAYPLSRTISFGLSLTL
ncbi:MAG: TonB-dependent receptor [Tannerella sp.]|jgi:TonB-linked SusC/RagA family outer membrane protein|nr:TonB-dependent receptor [Tannerella sp.]